MTKRSPSKFHLCKKLTKNYNNVWGLPKGNTLKAVKNKKKTKKNFKKLLSIKQSLKIFYCTIPEQGFKRLLKKSIRSPLTTLDRFISFLECRLDIVLFRSCLISSLYKARQVINHGGVGVNKKAVKNPGTNLNKSDVVEFKNIKFVDNITKVFISRFIPPHLEIDYKTFCIVFLWSPNYNSIYYPIKSNYSVIQRFYK